MNYGVSLALGWLSILVTVSIIVLGYVMLGGTIPPVGAAFVLGMLSGALIWSIATRPM